MFKLPDFLVKATGAMNFADPLKNGGLPTMGDAMQGIGHSMAEYYRNGGPPAPASASPVQPLQIAQQAMPLMPNMAAQAAGKPLTQATPWGGTVLDALRALQ